MKNLERLEYLFGNTNIEKLKQAKVAVIGLGGVGGVAALALARCGVGSLIFKIMILFKKAISTGN